MIAEIHSFCTTYVLFILVYVPVNQQQSESRSKNSNNNNNNNKQQVTLKFRLTARDEDYTEPEPLWKLKITQLECQTTSTNWWKIKDLARQVWDWEDEERDASKSKYSLGKEDKIDNAPNLQLNTQNMTILYYIRQSVCLPHYLIRRKFIICLLFFSTRRLFAILH